MFWIDAKHFYSKFFLIFFGFVFFALLNERGNVITSKVLDRELFIAMVTYRLYGLAQILNSWRIRWLLWKHQIMDQRFMHLIFYNISGINSNTWGNDFVSHSNWLCSDSKLPNNIRTYVSISNHLRMFFKLSTFYLWICIERFHSCWLNAFFNAIRPIENLKFHLEILLIAVGDLFKEMSR